MSDEALAEAEKSKLSSTINKRLMNDEALVAESGNSKLDNYKAYLDSLAKNNSSDIFTNGGWDHAAILLSKLINYTETEIRMFCEELKITESIFIEALDEYLQNGKTIKLLLQKVPSNNRSYDLLKKYQQDRNNDTIKIKQINEDGRSVSSLFSSFNFSVFDRNKFRLEIEPKEFKALGSFNSPDSAMPLLNIFDKAFDKSDDVY